MAWRSLPGGKSIPERIPMLRLNRRMISFQAKSNC
jgi:hypothetical protein